MYMFTLLKRRAREVRIEEKLGEFFRDRKPEKTKRQKQTNQTDKHTKETSLQILQSGPNKLVQ